VASEGKTPGHSCLVIKNTWHLPSRSTTKQQDLRDVQSLHSFIGFLQTDQAALSRPHLVSAILSDQALFTPSEETSGCW
jgi:hypothetical protein